MKSTGGQENGQLVVKDRKGHFQVCLFEEKKNQDYIRITEIIWNHIRMTQNLRKLWLLGAPTLVQAKGKHIGIPLFVRAGLSRGVSRLEFLPGRGPAFHYLVAGLHTQGWTN